MAHTNDKNTLPLSNASPSSHHNLHTFGEYSNATTIDMMKPQKEEYDSPPPSLPKDITVTTMVVRSASIQHTRNRKNNTITNMTKFPSCSTNDSNTNRSNEQKRKAINAPASHSTTTNSGGGGGSGGSGSGNIIGIAPAQKQQRQQPQTSERVMCDRIKFGLCPTCGTKVYHICKEWTWTGRRTKMVNIKDTPGIVMGGRCLYCYPANDNHNKVATVAEKHGENVPLGLRQNVVETTNPHQQQHESSDADTSTSTSSTQHLSTISSSSTSTSTSPSSNTISSRATSLSCSTDYQGSLGKDRNSLCPLRATLKDAQGFVFVGKITHGTSNKGEGIFTHVVCEDREVNRDALGGKEKEGEVCSTATSSSKATPTANTSRTMTTRSNTCVGHIRTDGAPTISSNVVRYRGEFANRRFEGRGILYDVDGTVYRGQFKKSHRHGCGREAYSDGQIYHGEFQNDMIHGRGECNYPNGDWYDGEWEKDVYSGQGKFSYAKNGNWYDGGWKNGKKYGQGILFSHDGDIIEKVKYKEGGERDKE